ncbi:BamA/TamA family outer membrane protein [Flavobacterium franklandianum]|uniref:BamA/TamA family outer membrane protein n=1 Tax=Flavobacterium franklandianum TaxID=2594430 RepID=A0A553CKX7_9FLAO|nr:BamA/TamA family outer membrane protein [Flavobacterium franklandianum]TRX21097.1 BamA/TamA family outer membrane protein [Flavobacterium franklandianum]TRX29140.1 BamA/TamA family outer membrane protein [Flavobacterium franklandianum]
MKKISTKIATFIVIGIIISACDAEKRIPNGKQRLTKNEILVNGKASKSEDITNQLYQKPNSTFLGYKLRLNLFNLATPNPDSVFQAKFINHPEKYEQMSKWLSAKQVDRLGQSFWYLGIDNFLKKTGEPPVIVDTVRSSKSISKIEYYYFNKGFFDVKASYKLDSISVKKAKIKYTITTGNPFFLDTLTTSIKTPALDSLYKTRVSSSVLKSGKQYNTKDFEDEKERITTHFRNQGVYNFQPNYVTFDLDTLNNNKKVNVNLIINDYSFQEKDSTKTEPFKIFKISDVNIYTDYSATNNSNVFADSTTYNNFNLYSHSKLKYKPKAIADAVFITKGGVFADFKTVLTTRYLNNLKIFNYPTILYKIDERDSTANSLIANVYLSPRKKYGLGTTFDVTHSNIQDVGIAGSISETIRNVFSGAETLELSARGNIGSSKDLANPESKFFNVSEYGMDLKLNIPRIWFPFATEKIIPKSMIPSTLVSTGLSNQKNIGLDKQNVTGVLAYNWNPKRNNTARFDIFNIQYVRNLNPENYFNVYESSFTELNNLAKTYNTNPDYVDVNTGDLIIEEGTSGFANDVKNGTIVVPDPDYSIISSIEERRIRLTENDFILSTSYSFSKTTKTDLEDNTFYQFRTKIESAGSLLSLVSNAANLPKNKNGNYDIFNLEYSEYVKTEFDYVKYWDLSKEKVIAVRSFFGIAIPYGNSNNIPFSRSYFAGGSNDNRAWEPYRLGPGSTGAVNDYNEANMKIALSAEFRFKILGSVKGAFFADAGNIWNVFDNITDTRATFDGFKDLKEIALGTGFGLRYDLDFFVVRFDLGFKTFNPANEMGKRWFYDYDFAHSVFNFGINYPF